MYSPKIREDLIPKVYQAAKKTGLAMTTWVNQAIERALFDVEKPVGQGTRNENSREEERSNDR